MGFPFVLFVSASSSRTFSSQRKKEEASETVTTLEGSITAMGTIEHLQEQRREVLAKLRDGKTAITRDQVSPVVYIRWYGL